MGKILALTATSMFFATGLWGQSLEPVESGEFPLVLPSALSGAGDTPFVTEVRTEKSCPGGMAEIYTSDIPDQSWNVVELGVQTPMEPKVPFRGQLYTRYTCAGPIDKP